MPRETEPVNDHGTPLSGERTPSSFPGHFELPLDSVSWGPDVPDDSVLRLIGAARDKRILQLGVGMGHNAVALALAGAHVIAVDTEMAHIEAARQLADANEVRIEVHHGDPADLAFVRADTIDTAISVFELGRVEDLDRVLRQVNRVLRTGGALVCSLPHPAWLMVDHETAGDPRIANAYGERTALTFDGNVVHPRSIAEVFSSFARANFRVDTVLEPMARRGHTPSPFWSETMNLLPATLIVRGRKDGV
jgi:SAM-dependent methyltransferase